MTTSFSDYSTMAIFQARSFVTRVTFASRGSSYFAMEVDEAETIVAREIH